MQLWRIKLAVNRAGRFPSALRLAVGIAGTVVSTGTAAAGLEAAPTEIASELTEADSAAAIAHTAPRLNAQGLSHSDWANKGVVPISVATERYVREDPLKRVNRVALGDPGEAFSALLNYRVGRAAEASGDAQTRVDVDTHVRYRNWLIESESAHRFGNGLGEQVRLGTSVAYDLTASTQRFTFGDQFALSGELGAPARLFGVGFGRAAATPFNSLYAGSERLRFFDTAPASGRADYGYRLGWLRENYGIESNHYGEVAFAGHQRWGLGGGKAVGLTLDATAKGWSGGGTMMSKLGGLGTLSAAVAKSTTEAGATRREGYAAALSHRYQAGGFNARGFFRGQSLDYRNPLAEAAGEQRRWLAGVDAGFSAGSLGSFSALAARAEYFNSEVGSTEIGLGYNKSFASRARLTASLTRTVGAGEGLSGLLGFSYSFANPRAASF